jgi:hypothetical protein
MYNTDWCPGPSGCKIGCINGCAKNSNGIKALGSNGLRLTFASISQSNPIILGHVVPEKNIIFVELHGVANKDNSTIVLLFRVKKHKNG